MIGESIRPELVNSFTRGAGIKGQNLDLGTQLLPVMIVEDLSRGPYPPSAIWQAGTVLAGDVANVSHVGVGNISTQVGSSMVVDYILTHTTSAGSPEIVLIVTSVLIAGLTVAPALARDCSNERGTPVHDPPYGNVQIGGLQNPVGLNGTLVGAPTNTALTRIDGPWTLGPGGALMVRGNALNVGIFGFFKGRYYPGV